MDLDHIERCATPESDKSRSHLKLQLFRDYSVSDASKNSLASSPKSTRSKVELLSMDFFKSSFFADMMKFFSTDQSRCNAK